MSNMTLPNIQSHHPFIHAEFVCASELERQAADLLKKAEVFGEGGCGVERSS